MWEEAEHVVEDVSMHDAVEVDGTHIARKQLEDRGKVGNG